MPTLCLANNQWDALEKLLDDTIENLTFRPGGSQTQMVLVDLIEQFTLYSGIRERLRNGECIDTSVFGLQGQSDDKVLNSEIAAILANPYKQTISSY